MNANFKQQYLQMMVGIVMELWKISYVEKQITQAHIDNSQTTTSSLQNHNVNGSLANDIDYQYGDAFNLGSHEYPYSDNLSRRDYYDGPNFVENNMSERMEDIGFGNFTNPIEDYNPQSIGGVVSQLFQWISVPFKWMSTISNCITGDGPPLGYVCLTIL